MRATWDYEQRREEFLAWARSLPRMLNSAAVFEWNTDKAYLTQLADAGVSVVPTVVVERSEDLLGAVAGFGHAVVKPCVGAGGRGVVVLRRVVRRTSPTSAPARGWCSRWSSRCAPRARPRSSSSTARSSRRRRSARLPGELRVHEMYGGTTVATPVTDEAAELARRTVAAAERILGERLDYARVDQMRLADGTLAVSELEVTEPGLYLEVIPDNAAAFADLVVDRLRTS